VKAAEEAFKNAVKTADMIRGQEVAAANQEYQAAEQSARAERDAPLPPHPSIDLAALLAGEAQKIAQATDTYDAIVAEEQARYTHST
jgi:hypothetical protein